MSIKLYKVTCRGMRVSLTSPTHGVAYVLAPDPADAYATMLADLDKRDLGLPSDRVMASVELIAEDTKYPACRVRVYT